MDLTWWSELWNSQWWFFILFLTFYFLILLYLLKIFWYIYHFFVNLEFDFFLNGEISKSNLNFISVFLNLIIFIIMLLYPKEQEQILH